MPSPASISLLPAALAGLCAATAYPHPVTAIEVIETHMSWVVLTGEFAYKIKRPVHYPFVDMRSFARREFLCHEELRLNRRFAPQLYLEVCNITSAADGTVRVNGAGTVIEHAVRMRQFSRAEELDRLLESGQIGPAELEDFGAALAAVHARMPAVDEQQPWGRPQRIAAQLRRNFLECQQALGCDAAAAGCAALQQPFEQCIAAATPWLAARRAGGRVRECHGDLHCRNVVRLAGGLVGFDSLEFEPEFRWIDVAEEIALLLTDMESRDCPDHVHAFLSGYLAASGDYDAATGLNLYKAHHALVRAKVAAISAGIAGDALRHSEWQRDCQRLLAAASRALGTHQPRLLLTCGLSGSGKTWLARQLVVRLRCLHLRSDVVRKQLAGMMPLASSQSPVGQGLYTDSNISAVYRELARHSAAILAGGYSVIVDATFASRAERQRFGALSIQLGVPIRLLECRAPMAVMRARIAARQQSAIDASEADERVLDWQMRHFEPVTADELLPTTLVDTDAIDAIDRLIATFA